MSCINSIPSVIIEAILLRLPPQSLGRFKSVSKEWNSLISNPKFIKTHTHQLLLQPKPAKKLFAMSTDTRSLYSIELSIDNNSDTIPATVKEITLGSPPMRWGDYMGSCNGLVLAIGLNNAMFMMNPTTLDLWKLPVNPLAPDDYSVYYGFDYHSSTDDYKVVFICKNSVSIYSLRNNSWRELPNTPHRLDQGGSCALVNGNCHWLPYYSSSIIAFSFVDELFSEIKLPDSILNINFRYISMVVEIGGRLGVNSCLWSGDYELWVMQEYGDVKSWTRVFSHKDYMRPLCLLQGSDQDIVFDCVNRVDVFNIDQGRCRNVSIVGDPCRFIIQGSFVESIESTKRIFKTP